MPIRSSQLHLHNFLVGRNNFIARLQKHFELQFSLLLRKDRRVQILIFPRKKILDLRISRRTRALHLLYRGCEHILKSTSRRGIRAIERDGFDGGRRPD